MSRQTRIRQMLTAVNNKASAPRRRPQREVGRIYVLAAMLIVGLLLVAGRLAKLQIVDGDDYAAQAKRQYESNVVLQAERGPLYDRNGNLLATNAVSVSFAVDPTHVKNPAKLAREFSRVLGDPYEIWYDKLTARNKSFVWLKRKVSGAQLEALKDLDDDGLIKLKEPLRHFEYASLGAQAIGCTDIDNDGLNGIELFYNEQLRGNDGFMVMQRDARGHRRPDVDLPRQQPEHGSALVLTLDINIQGIVEDELKRGVDRAGALSGTAIALDPRTGEILAIASYPSYDPNNLREATQDAIRVRAITDMYEPGSTMKVVTAAAALEEDVVDPEEMIDCEGGEYRFGGHVVRDEHPAGELDFRQSLEQSSNIAFAKIASRIAPPRFYKYVRDFGFGIISGVDLPGEAKGEVKKPDEFKEGTQEFMAFGYQLAVTPLQLVCAYAAIANGGVMMKPHLLKKRLDRNGEVIEEIGAQEIRRVVSRETADTLGAMLVGVVEKGTGKAARIEGLRVAGKTGTAQQITGGFYSKEKYNASFVGFFPADDPKVTLLVLLDSPTNGYYGGHVAAPIFREIARRIIGASVDEERAEPVYASASRAGAQPVSGFSRIHVPDLRGIEAEPARELAEKYGYRVVVRGGGNVVAAQQPGAGEIAEALSVITLTMAAPAEAPLMPDVRGMSLRRALNILNAHRIKPSVSGAGIVRSQSPAPNTPGKAAKLICR